MKQRKWLLLQLFAGGGEGAAAGDGGAQASASGDTGADAGHNARLLELGVPADKLRRANKPAAASAAAAPQDAAGESEDAGKPKARRLTWEEVKQDPEYSQHMQAMVQSRLKNVKQAQENLQKLTPALEVMARAYGLDPKKLDYDALANAISGDDRLYEKRATELGVSTQVAKKLQQLDQIQQQQKEAAEDLALRRHFGKLQQQSEAMKQAYPQFDLQKELKNPAFVRLTAPNVGLSVEDAYCTVHRRELQAAAMQFSAQTTAQRISSAIQSGSRRPQENGTSSHAPSVTTFDYKNASREQREALKQQIRLAAARGEKLYPGSL